MSRYLITIEYDGTPFEGWQAQEGKRTIEGEIENAIYNVTHEKVTLFGSGRTDSGVHAIAQMAHFDLEEDVDANKLPRALNFYLPNEIAIKSAEIVASDFHARYNVKKKTYLYKIYLGKNRSPLRANRCMEVHYDLDVDKMIRASKALLGIHNFEGLMTKGSSVKTTIREIFDVKIEKVLDELHIYVSGSGFLYNMVRTIVGTLVDIGRGYREVEVMSKIVNNGDASLKGPVAPASGLYLYKVEY